MKRIQFFSLLCLLIVLPISFVTADMGVTWVRTGVVLEVQHKNGVAGEINVATMSNNTAHALAEAPIIQRLDANRVLLQFAWQPNQNYQFRLSDSEITATSPLKPEPYLIRTVELDGHLSLMENLRQPAKPSAVALGHGNAPNTEKLAVATNSGHLAILQPITGETLWKTRISEGYVKQMVFSPDNTLLYVGEQAADGFMYCYDLTSDTPTLRWKYRTADDIETSTPSDPSSVYAWRFDVSADGKTLALLTDSGHNLQGSATDESDAGNGKLSVLNAEDGTEKWHMDIEPLREYFAQVTFWRGVSMSPDGKFINVTTDDGRAFIFDVNQREPIWQENLATPLEVSGIPIIATTGTIGATDAAALFVTGDTYIPYHLRKGAQKPAAGHPNGMTLFAYSWRGEKIWQWKLENMPQGLRICSMVYLVLFGCWSLTVGNHYRLNQNLQDLRIFRIIDAF